MTRLRLFAFAAVAVLAAVAGADDTPAKSTKIDPDKLVGTYKVVAGLKAGEKISDDSKDAPIVFAKDKITVKNSAGTFVFSYKLDTDKEPNTVELVGVEPEFVKDKAVKGIMKYEGGKVYLAYGDPTDDKAGRPTDFKSTAENKVFSFEMKKEGGKAKGKKTDDKKDD